MMPNEFGSEHVEQDAEEDFGAERLREDQGPWRRSFAVRSRHLSPRRPCIWPVIAQ
jgi:hypothetical protein